MCYLSVVAVILALLAVSALAIDIYFETKRSWGENENSFSESWRRVS